MQNKIGAPPFLAVGRLVYKWEEKNDLHVKFLLLLGGTTWGEPTDFRKPNSPTCDMVSIYSYTIRKTLKRLTWKSDWQSEHISFLEQLAPLRLFFPLRWTIFHLHWLIVQDDLRWIYLHLLLGYLTLHLQIEPSQNLTRARPGKNMFKRSFIKSTCSKGKKFVNAMTITRMPIKKRKVAANCRHLLLCLLSFLPWPTSLNHCCTIFTD